MINKLHPYGSQCCSIRSCLFICEDNQNLSFGLLEIKNSNDFIGVNRWF